MNDLTDYMLLTDHKGEEKNSPSNLENGQPPLKAADLLSCVEGSLVDDTNWLRTTDIIKHCATTIAIALPIACLTIPVLIPFTPILIATSVSIFSFGQTLTSHDKLSTVAKGISIIVSALTAALIFGSLSVTWPSIIAAIGMFYTNKILYDGNISTLLKSFKHFFNQPTWTGVAKNLILAPLACTAAWYVTLGMLAGAATLLGFLGLTSSWLMSPFIVAPIVISLGLSMLAFAKCGLVSFIKFSRTASNCFDREDLSKGLLTYLYNGFKRIFRACTQSNKHDNYKTLAIKIAAALLLVALVVGVTYFSQVGLIAHLVVSIAKMSLHLPKALTFINSLSSFMLACTPIIIAASVARMLIVGPSIIRVFDKIKNYFVSKLDKDETNNAATTKNISLSWSAYMHQKMLHAMISQNKMQRVNEKIIRTFKNKKKNPTEKNEEKALRERLYSGALNEAKKNYNKLNIVQKGYYFMSALSSMVTYPLSYVSLLLNTAGNFYLCNDPIGRYTNGTASLGINGNALLQKNQSGLFYQIEDESRDANHNIHNQSIEAEEKPLDENNNIDDEFITEGDLKIGNNERTDRTTDSTSTVGTPSPI
jgi:hypothetical protein